MVYPVLGANLLRQVVNVYRYCYSTRQLESVLGIRGDAKGRLESSRGGAGNTCLTGET